MVEQLEGRRGRRAESIQELRHQLVALTVAGSLQKRQRPLVARRDQPSSCATSLGSWPPTSPAETDPVLRDRFA